MHNMYVYVSKYGDGEESTFDHSNALLTNLMEKTDMREYVARKIPQWDDEMEGQTSAKARKLSRCRSFLGSVRRTET